MAICGHFGPKVALRGILTPHKTFDPGPNYLIPMWAPSENPLGATFILEKIRKAISEIEYPPPLPRSGVRPYHVVGGPDLQMCSLVTFSTPFLASSS